MLTPSDHVAELQEEIIQLKQKLREVARPLSTVDPAWRLRRKEARVMCVLMGGKIVPLHMIKTIAYGNDDIEDGTIYTEVARLRRKLKPFGMHINAHYGIGYQLVGFTK